MMATLIEEQALVHAASAAAEASSPTEYGGSPNKSVDKTHTRLMEGSWCVIVAFLGRCDGRRRVPCYLLN